MTKEEFNIKYKRLRRQLNERSKKVELNQKSFPYFENKRLEFQDFIDEALKTDWFIRPKETTLIYKLYHDS